MRTPSKRTSIFVFSFLMLCVVSFADGVGNSTTASNVTEIISLRNANTRVWTVPNIRAKYDILTGLPTGALETVQSVYYEKADGLNYLSSGTTWLPTVEQITTSSNLNYPYQALQGPAQVQFAGTLGATYPIQYTIETSTLQLGLRSLAFYDKKNNILQTIQDVSPSSPTLQGNTLTYPSAFTGIDVFYIYHKGSFMQDLVFNNESAIPSPSVYSLDTSELYVVSVTELDQTNFPYTLQNYAGNTINDGFLSGVGTDLYFNDSSTGRMICQFAVSQAFDNSSPHPVRMYRHIVQENGHTYLVEGVPFSWTQTAHYPVTLDYNLKPESGTQSDNEVWKSGNTYYVDGTYTVNGILAIEGGTICKFSTGTQIEINSGDLIAKGDKFNYILFTSWLDTTMGANVLSAGTTYSAPSAGNYYEALDFTENYTNNSLIEYCKIAYANIGIGFYSNTGGPEGGSIIINNSIIRAGNEGVDLEGDGSVTLLNDLIVAMSAEGIVAGVPPDQSSNNVICCTIDACTTGLEENDINDSASDHIVKNSLFTNCVTAFSGNWSTHDYNTFWQNTTDFSGTSANTHEYDLSSSPYASSPIGSHYLIPGTTHLTNAGDSSASIYGLDTKTTTTAALILGSISGTSTWYLVPRDTTAKVDMGYHADPVDIIIGNSSTNDQLTITGSLTISTGAVIAFYRSNTTMNAEIYVINGGQIILPASTTGSLVEFTSIYAVGSLQTLPLRGGLDPFDYDYGIFREGGSSPECSIQYARFQYAEIGVLSLDTQNIDQTIQNNVFRSNQYGVYFNGFSGNVVNNMFVDNTAGIVSQNHINPYQIHYIQSNTFYDNQTGVMVLLSVSTCTTLVRMENNIFMGNIAGAFGVSSYSNISAETRNNVYFDNSTDVDGTYISINTAGADNADQTGNANPLLVHQTTLANNAFLSSTTNDGFYLAQNSGDASRFPLLINDVTDMSVSFTNTPLTSSQITVYASYNAGVGTQVGFKNNASGTWQSYSHTGPANGYLLLKFCVPSGTSWNIVSGDYVVLTLQTGSKITTFLPSVTVTNSNSLYIWVAADGSSYWGNSSHSAGALNQDASFALEYDMTTVTGGSGTGLAKSAYSAGERSVAIDQGSVKVTTINSTTYRYTTMASLGSTNTNGTQDNSSTIRIIQPTLTTNTVDPIGRLDIGYHYNGSVVYTIDMCTAVQIPFGGSTTMNLIPFLNSYMKTNIASAETNPNNLVDETMTLYNLGNTDYVTNSNVTTYPGNHLIGLAYHVQNTPINNLVFSFSAHEGESETHGQIYNAPLAVSPVDNTLVAGVAYYASGIDDLTTIDAHVAVYKYSEPSNSWSRIAHVTVYPADYESLSDVALAVDSNNNVCVTWVQKNTTLAYPYSAQINAAVVPITANDTDISSGYSTPVTKLDIDYYNDLSMTYDPQAVNPSINANGVRLALINQISSDSMFRLRESPLEVSVSGIVTLEYPDGNMVTEVTQTGNGYPKIVYNPWNTDTSPAYQDFASAFESEIGDGDIRAYDLTNPSSDIWSVDSAFLQGSQYANYGQQDLTYCVTGQKMVVWLPYLGSQLISNRGTLVNLYDTTTSGYPRISTNAGNQRDLFITWTDGSNSSGSAVQAVYTHELYP